MDAEDRQVAALIANLSRENDSLRERLSAAERRVCAYESVRHIDPPPTRWDGVSISPPIEKMCRDGRIQKIELQGFVANEQVMFADRFLDDLRHKFLAHIGKLLTIENRDDAKGYGRVTKLSLIVGLLK